MYLVYSISLTEKSRHNIAIILVVVLITENVYTVLCGVDEQIIALLVGFFISGCFHFLK